MATRMLRVRATRRFNAHHVGDELLVADDPQIKRLVKAGLFELIAIESVVTLDELSDGEAVTVPPVDEADDEVPPQDLSPMPDVWAPPEHAAEPDMVADFKPKALPRKPRKTRKKANSNV